MKKRIVIVTVLILLLVVLIVAIARPRWNVATLHVTDAVSGTPLSRYQVGYSLANGGMTDTTYWWGNVEAMLARKRAMTVFRTDTGFRFEWSGWSDREVELFADGYNIVRMRVADGEYHAKLEPGPEGRQMRERLEKLFDLHGLKRGNLETHASE